MTQKLTIASLSWVIIAKHDHVFLMEMYMDIYYRNYDISDSAVAISGWLS